MIEQKSSESCASTSGDLPPELENGPRSENTDKSYVLIRAMGVKRVSVDDGCLSHESKLLRFCNSLPRILLADSKSLSKHQACSSHGSNVNGKMCSEEVHS